MRSRLKIRSYSKNSSRILWGLYSCAVLAFTAPLQAADWISEPVAICSADGTQESPRGVSDGAGGAIFSWIDKRNGSRAIYAQRINPMGELQWPGEGVAICAPLTDLYATPEVISDGLGGAIIGWTDKRNNVSGVYAQRVSSTGSVLWTANGVAVSPNIGVRYTPKMAADGAGGAILVWRGYKSSEYNIYAQRISSAGAKQWGSVDLPIATSIGYEQECELVTDGLGGAIISWYDRRGVDYDIYAQRVSHAGVIYWKVNGIPICVAVADQADPRIAPDGVGGAIITWEDFRTGVYDIYAQRINGAGAIQWALNGISVCSMAGRQWLPQIVPDGSGGAIITWDDSRRGAGIIDLFAQRVDSAGIPMWTSNGVAIGLSVVQQTKVTAPVVSGGAIIAWKNPYDGDFMTVVKEVNSAGQSVPESGARVLTGTSGPLLPGIVTDSDGRAILAWEDSLMENFDIYAIQVRLPTKNATVTDWALY